MKVNENNLQVFEVSFDKNNIEMALKSKVKHRQIFYVIIDRKDETGKLNRTFIETALREYLEKTKEKNEKYTIDVSEFMVKYIGNE